VSGQLALPMGATCKTEDCPRPVVGQSISGAGAVCRECNTAEWGRSLSRASQPEWIQQLGRLCLSGPRERAA
jgi:hypothetical protein